MDKRLVSDVYCIICVCVCVSVSRSVGWSMENGKRYESTEKQLHVSAPSVRHTTLQCMLMLMMRRCWMLIRRRTAVSASVKDGRNTAPWPYDLTSISIIIFWIHSAIWAQTEHWMVYLCFGHHSVLCRLRNSCSRCRSNPMLCHLNVIHCTHIRDVYKHWFSFLATHRSRRSYLHSASYIISIFF